MIAITTRSSINVKAFFMALFLVVGGDDVLFGVKGCATNLKRRPQYLVMRGVRSPLSWKNRILGVLMWRKSRNLLRNQRIATTCAETVCSRGREFDALGCCLPGGSKLPVLRIICKIRRISRLCGEKSPRIDVSTCISRCYILLAFRVQVQECRQDRLCREDEAVDVDAVECVAG